MPLLNPYFYSDLVIHDDFLIVHAEIPPIKVKKTIVIFNSYHSVMTPPFLVNLNFSLCFHFAVSAVLNSVALNEPGPVC